MIYYEKHYGNKTGAKGFTIILHGEDDLDEIALIGFRKNKTPLKIVPDVKRQKRSRYQ